MISAVSLLLLLLFGWRPTSTHTTLPHMALFFLGAGFMLLETKAIVHMALVFGSTWVVNTSSVLGHPGNHPDSKLVGAEAPAH
jgi:membrane-bound ClpP family serine protease